MTDQAQNNRTRIAYSFENSLTPTTMKRLLVSSTDITRKKDNIDSDLIDETTRRYDVINVGARLEGGIESEFSAGTFDDFLKNVFHNEFSTAVSGSDDFTVTAATGTYTATGTIFANAQVGQWLYFSGFANAGNNGWKRVLTKASSSEITTSTTGLVNETDTGISVKGKMLKDGTTKYPMCIETSSLDVDVFEIFKDFVFSGVSVDASAKQKVNISFSGGIGLDYNISNSGNSSAYTDASTAPIMNSTGNLVSLTIDGVSMAAYFSSVGIKIDRGLQSNDACMSLYPVGHRLGTIDASVSMSAYLQDKTILEAIKNHDTVSVNIAFSDGTDSVMFTFDSAVYAEGDSPIDGKNNSRMVSLVFQTKKNTTYGSQVQYDTTKVS